MALRLITDATAEPVTLAEIKTFLRLSTVGTAEDTLLNSLIKSSRKIFENKSGRACLPQTWKLFLNTFEDEMILNISPLSTSTANIAITFLDSVSGQSTALSSTVFRIDADSEPGRIYLDDGQAWPDHYDVPNAVQIQFVAGFPLTTPGDSDNCPEEVKTWIKMRTAAMYENREAFSEKGLQEMPHSFLDGLIDRDIIIDVRP